MPQWTDIGGPTSIYNTVYDPVNGILYAGIFGGGVWKYDGANWTDIGGPIATYTVWALACDSAGNLYIGTRDHGVWKYDGAWTDTAGAITTYEVWCLVYDSVHGILYAGTGEFDPDTGYAEGIWKYDGATWTVVSSIINGANKLSAQNSSLEAAGVGDWTVAYATCTLANSTTWAAVGTHSLEITPIAGAMPWFAIDVTAVTSPSTPYTFSCQFRGISGKWYTVSLYDDVSGVQDGWSIGCSFQADGTTQRITFTGSFGAGSTYRQFGIVTAQTHTAAQVIYADNFRIVAGIDVATFSVSYLAYDPTNNILYAGAEPWVQNNAGIWKCVNPNTAPVWTQFADAVVDRGHAWALVYDPVEDVLYAGAYQNVGSNDTIGILRYDGSSWTNLGLTDYSIWYLDYDATDATLYVGTISSGIRIYRDGNWSNVTSNLPTGNRDTLDSDSLCSVDVSAANIYCATWSEGVWYKAAPSPPRREDFSFSTGALKIEIWNKADTDRLSILTKDNKDPALVYQDLEFSNNNWGYLSCTFTLKRDSEMYWEDLEDSNIVRLGVWEGDIESVGRDKDKETALKVECLGPQARVKNMGTDADYDKDLEPGEKASLYIVDHVLTDLDLGLFEGDIDTNDFAIVTGCNFFPGKAFDQIFSQLMEYNQYRPSIWLNNQLNWKPRETTISYYVSLSDCETSSLNRKRASIVNWIQVAFSPDNSVYGYIVAFDQDSIDKHGKRSLYLSIRGDETDANQVAATALANLKDLKPASALTTDIIHDAYGGLVPPEEVESNKVLHIEKLLSTEETIESAQSINESNTWEIAEVKYTGGKVTLSPGDADDTLDVLLKQLDSRFL